LGTGMTRVLYWSETEKEQFFVKRKEQQQKFGRRKARQLNIPEKAEC